MFSLKDYSVFSAIVISGNTFCNAQVIYTDIEPDAIVGADDQFIDLNDDGFEDFEIIKEYLFTSNTELIKCYSSILFEVGCLNPENSLVGNQRDYVNDIVYALSYGTLINESVELTPDGWQYATFKQKEISCVYWNTIGPWIYPDIGNWFSHREEDMYIGVKFKDDSEDCFYFGWIRCVISDSLDQMAIKDYAYNAECNKGLYAGKLISGISNYNEYSIVADVYYADDKIHISVTESSGDLNCILYNLSGEVIFEQKINELNNIISTNNFLSGIYFIQLVSEAEAKFSRSVIIK